MKVIKQTETATHHIRIADDLPMFGGYYSVETAEKRMDGFLYWKQFGNCTRILSEADNVFNQAVLKFAN